MSLLHVRLPGFEVYNGDVLEVLREIPDESVDSVATDPPYGFDPFAPEKDWGQKDKRRDMSHDADAARQQGLTEAEALKQRLANGINYEDDGPRIPFDVWGVAPVVGGYAKEKGFEHLARYITTPQAKLHYQLWMAMIGAELVRILKPGGHVAAFNCTKFYHRMAVGLEDGGLELRDTINWVYGQGMPHGAAPWQAMDRQAGMESLLVPPPGLTPMDLVDSGKKDVKYPASESGQEWYGWHTGLKPCVEPIALLRKPFSGPLHKNLLKHRTGALNVRAAAVPAGDKVRWPGNMLLTHSPDCRMGDPCVPYCPVAVLEAQQQGSSSYFKQTWWGDLEYDMACGFDALYYQAKPRRGEKNDGLEGRRNPHPTVKPEAVMREIIALITPPGGRVADLFAGSGTTGRAAIQCGFYPILNDKDPAFAEIITTRCQNTQLPLLV